VRRRLTELRLPLVQFLSTHAAGDIAVVATDRAAPGAVVPSMTAAAEHGGDLFIVKTDGRVVGVIGPRERAALAGQDADAQSVMVPIASVVVLEPRSSGVELLPELARHGFALVDGPGGLGYVTPAVLGRRVGAWVRSEAGA
jgi:hypothetical protein